MTLRVQESLGTPVEVPIGLGSTRLDTPTGDEEFVLVLYSDATSSGSYTIGSGAPLTSLTRVETKATTARDAWHRWLRLQEQRTRDLPVARAQPVSKPVAEGDFRVLADLSGAAYETVTATLRYEGIRTLVYVDNRVLATELSDADVLRLGDTFDAAGGSHQTVRDTFGDESDVDGNAAVVILLTPTVNGLTPPGSGAFVGGFFFSQDLHAVANSNQMEILYGMVPDPTGRWGNVFPVGPTLDVLDGVLPHELQHAVSYANHVLLQGGDPEDLWLNEALSHVAEDLCGHPEQNVLRANLFLQAPQLVSMTTGGNALQERGMSYLYVQYVADHATGGFLRRLIETSHVGVSNVTNASGRDFLLWMRDWAVTLTLVPQGLGTAPWVYSSLDLAADFDAPQEMVVDLAAPSASGTLPVSGVGYFRLRGTSNPWTDLQVSGDVHAVVMRVR
jgi:hypothetical protein